MYPEQSSTLSRRQLVEAAAGSLAASVLLRAETTSPVAVTVKSRRISDVPLERKIFGQFIEAGFGRQVEGMWAEMLYNRSFQPVSPYSASTWDWLGLKPEAYSAEAPFWHSGYEELDWELIAPNNTVRSRTRGTDTYKGKSSLVLNYDGGGVQGGLRQPGLVLKSGETYDFHIFGGLAAPRGSTQEQPVKIQFRADGFPGQVLAETTLRFASSQQEFHYEFVNRDYTGRAAVEIILERSATLRL